MMQQQHHPPVAPVRASPGVVSSTMMDDHRAAARVAVLNTPFQSVFTITSYQYFFCSLMQRGTFATFKNGYETI